MGKPINVRFSKDRVVFNLRNAYCRSKESLDIVIDRHDYHDLIEDTQHWFIEIDRYGQRVVTKSRSRHSGECKLHRIILSKFTKLPKYQFKKNIIVGDHINNNSLDDRRNNLQLLGNVDNSKKQLRPLGNNKYSTREIRISICYVEKVGIWQAYSRCKYIGASKDKNKVESMIRKFIKEEKERLTNEKVEKVKN